MFWLHVFDRCKILFVINYCFQQIQKIFEILTIFHFGVKTGFSEIPIFLRTFWFDLVGAIDILIATDIASMLSLSKQCCKYIVCPQINSQTVNINFNVKQRENKTAGP